MRQNLLLTFTFVLPLFFLTRATHGLLQNPTIAWPQAPPADLLRYWSMLMAHPLNQAHLNANNVGQQVPQSCVLMPAAFWNYVEHLVNHLPPQRLANLASLYNQFFAQPLPGLYERRLTGVRVLSNVIFCHLWLSQSPWHASTAHLMPDNCRLSEFDMYSSFMLKVRVLIRPSSYHFQSYQLTQYGEESFKLLQRLAARPTPWHLLQQI